MTKDFCSSLKDQDKDKDKDCIVKDQDKDCILVLKESLSTRTRTNITELTFVYILGLILLWIEDQFFHFAIIEREGVLASWTGRPSDN